MTVRMSVIKKSTNNAGEGVEKRELSYTVDGNVNWYTTIENSMEVPSKAKNRTTLQSSNPTLGHVFRENHNLKRYMHPNVYSNTVSNSQDTEAT